MARPKDVAVRADECEALHLQKTDPRIVVELLGAPKYAEFNEKQMMSKGAGVEGGTTESRATATLSTRAVGMQLLMSILANITVLSVGMGMAFPSVSITAMTNATDYMSMEQHEFSWFASLNAVVSPIGGLMVSVLLDRCGRKNTLYLINLFAIVAWITKATASRTDRDGMFAQLMFSRILIGIMCGLASSPCAIYTAEISHPTMRGRMSIMTPLGIASGVLFIYILGFFIPVDWRLISAICACLSVLGLFLVFFLPETPSWLISKGRLKEAEASLKFFRGLNPREPYITPACQLELNLLVEKSRASLAIGNESLLTKFKEPSLYRPLSIMVGFFAFQQGSGLFVVVVYASKLCLTAGIELDPFLCAVYLGTMRIIGTFAIGFLMDRFGRRVLAIQSGLVMGVCMVGISVYCALGVTTMSWLPLVLILIYFLSGSLGILTLPFTMTAEVYPQRYRGLASGLTTCALFFSSFVVTKLYPTMVFYLGSAAVFAVYGVVSLLSVVFVYYLLPETRGKTLDQIGDLFRKPEKGEKLNENLMMIDKSALKKTISA